jgi:hypothetical protein
MSQFKWRVCKHPDKMVDWLTQQRDSRKMRLFAAACCRRIWHLATDERSRRAIEATERFADDLISLEELERFHRDATDAEFTPAISGSEPLPFVRLAFRDVAVSAAHAYAGSLDLPGGRCWQNAFYDELRSQSFLLRDIYREGALTSPPHASWLYAPASVKLAEAIYQDRAFDRLPILADSLEEAGCTDADVLSHCRGDGPHVRGCWVVDLILRKH